MSRNLKCHLCGSIFQCKGLLRCWCSGIQIPRERLREISILASDCVCKECLNGE